MLDIIRSFLRDEDGSTATEYAMVASLMAVVTIGALRALSSNISTQWSMIADTIGN